MGLPAIHSLSISGFLEEDVRGALSEAEGTDVAIAALTLVTLCQGDRDRGRPPMYAAAARTVWRVEGDGRPEPHVSVFDWGGDVPGVPPLRIWYLQQGNAAPVGIGAFSGSEGAVRLEGILVYPEAVAIEERVKLILRAPASRLVGDEE